MKILVLDEEFPWPIHSGKRTRSFNLYRRLARAADVVYVAHTDDTGEAEPALQEVGIRTVAVDRTLPPNAGPAFYARLVRNLFSPRPYMAARHYSRAYDRVVRRVAREDPDVVIAEWTPYALFFDALPRSVPRIVSTHNVESDIWLRYYRNETRAVRRLYMNLQWRKVRAFERAMLADAAGATAVSDIDAARLRAWCPQLTVESIDNGVDLEYFHPSGESGNPDRLVFTGSMDWRPNQDAAHFFADEILPALRAAAPAFECAFVGRWPSPDVIALGRRAGIEITGTVDDVRPWIAGAGIYVVPLRIGGGTRLKILEALAMGKAVVSTGVGAEGLDIEDGVHYLRADDPDGFVAATLRLRGDAELRARLGHSGRERVVTRYGWDALAARFAGFLADRVAVVTGTGSTSSGPVAGIREAASR